MNKEKYKDLSLEYMNRNLEDCVRFVDVIHQVIAKETNRTKNIINDLTKIADDYRREAEDWRYTIEEYKINKLREDQENNKEGV